MIWAWIAWSARSGFATADVTFFVPFLPDSPDVINRRSALCRPLVDNPALSVGGQVPIRSG